MMMMMMMIVVTVISFLLQLHSQLPQSKTTTAQRFRPLDSTSDPHLHNNGHSQVPMLRPQYRGVPPLAKVRAPHSNQQSGEFLQNVTANGKKKWPSSIFFTKLYFSLQAQMQTPPLHTWITWSEGLSCDSPSLSSTSPPQAPGASAHGDTEP